MNNAGFTYQQAKEVLQKIVDAIPNEDKICEKYCMSISPALIDIKGTMVYPERTRMLVRTGNIHLELKVLNYNEDEQKGGSL